MNVTVTPDVVVNDGTLTIKGTSITRFSLEREIGRGANGVVFAGRRVWLDQPCAVKLWLTLRTHDKRDKVRQGLAEARKMAAAHPEWVAALYDADLVEGVFFTSMEFIDGETLKEYLKKPLTKNRRWWLARLYINGIDKTTTTGTAHGDAHAGNVIVFDYIVDKFETAKRLKLIDFGTSIFASDGASTDRHWRVVEETFERIVNVFDNYAPAKKQLESTFGALAAREEYLKIAHFDDLLDSLKIEAGVPPI